MSEDWAAVVASAIVNSGWENAQGDPYALLQARIAIVLRRLDMGEKPDVIADAKKALSQSSED